MAPQNQPGAIGVLLFALLERSPRTWTELADSDLVCVSARRTHYE